LATATLALAVFFGFREHSIAQLHGEIHAVQNEQAEVETTIADLEARLDRRDDLDYIEYLARKELGLIRPGEEKYILIHEPQQ